MTAITHTTVEVGIRTAHHRVIQAKDSKTTLTLEVKVVVLAVIGVNHHFLSPLGIGVVGQVDLTEEAHIQVVELLLMARRTVFLCVEYLSSQTNTTFEGFSIHYRQPLWILFTNRLAALAELQKSCLQMATIVQELWESTRSVWNIDILSCFFTTHKNLWSGFI